MSAKLGKIATAKVEGDYCYNCDETFALSNLIERDDELYCESCYEELPIYRVNCMEEVDEEGQFCSKSCLKEYQWDMRDKTLDR